ncbi:unnamed protein product [Moneuplotes crassus]|uniref:Uncharacterized protein n=1 Tax=Euplotes crassus TaxID=5936 RepID=A0AAD1UFP3_EUPCR|nr:unnamed protein product [Moneuplotes crassus]
MKPPRPNKIKIFKKNAIKPQKDLKIRLATDEPPSMMAGVLEPQAPRTIAKKVYKPLINLGEMNRETAKMYYGYMKIKKSKIKHKKSKSIESGYSYTFLRKKPKKKINYLSPSQVLLKNQDANVDEIIHMTKITAERIRKNQKNNFGIPKNVNWQKVFSNGNESYEGNVMRRNKSEQSHKFDMDLFFNDLKWQNISKKSKKNIPLPTFNNFGRSPQRMERDQVNNRLSQHRNSPVKMVSRSYLDQEDSQILNVQHEELSSTIRKKDTPSCKTLSLHEDSDSEEQTKKKLQDRIKFLENELQKGSHQLQYKLPEKLKEQIKAKANRRQPSYMSKKGAGRSLKPPLSKFKKQTTKYNQKRTLYMNNMDISVSFDCDAQ